MRISVVNVGENCESKICCGIFCNLLCVKQSANATTTLAVHHHRLMWVAGKVCVFVDIYVLKELKAKENCIKIGDLRDLLTVGALYIYHLS